MRVLYLNHTSHMSGGERSLLELLDALPGEIEPHVGCPPGPLADAIASRGIAWHELAGTDGSLKLHPLHTPRTLVELARATRAVRELSRRHRIDVVHANSIRASLIASGASTAGGAPAVAHVRDCLPSGVVSGLVARIIRSRAARVVANSAYTLDRFGAGEMGVVVHNSVDQTRFAARRPASSASNGSFTLGVVAQLTPWKGQDDAVRALALVRAQHPDVRLVLAGSAKFVSAQTRFDNKAFVRDLKALIAELDLEDAVEFAGECEDVVSIYAGLDAVLVPSWEEPFGRAVIEAMAMGVPVIATDVGGTAEIVDDRRTGLLAPPRSPERWPRGASGPSITPRP
jgi:L-malate glycosyltransferase